MNDIFSIWSAWKKTLSQQAEGTKYLLEGLSRYNGEFIHPLAIATRQFQNVEAARSLKRTPLENGKSYLDLLRFNIDLFARYCLGTLKVAGQYQQKELESLYNAMFAALVERDTEQFSTCISRQNEILQWVARGYPEAIRAIEPEYGFHFERWPDSLIAETDRFVLRKVYPTEPGVVTDDTLKPLILIPPFVLGSNILSFLPGEKKSYAHCFANHSIPTYIRVMKDIHATPAVQTMTLEDDARDIRYFCEILKKRHEQPATLNGYCQGGFIALCALLSGELDGLVDALITCVAPIDGTRSQGLGGFLRALPETFNDLAYGTKTLPNGNRIADGELMGWIYKLKSIENSGPMVALIRDMMLGSSQLQCKQVHSKTVMALNYWLQNERSDLPLSVTEMSFASYNKPIEKDGTLPLTIFGRKLNLHAIQQKNIPWLICYGESDDLVEKEVALAPMDFIDVEVTPFPKGHVAIATSWSHPASSFALDAVFNNGSHRGPVRFHLDLAAGGTTAAMTAAID